MTTTKEDQMRAEFENIISSYPYKRDTSKGALGYLNDGTYIAFELYKACAESYEKTLAESNDLWKDLRNVLECTQRNLSEANARNARLVESLELVHTCSCTICADCADAVRRGINANAESVAAWEAEKLDPLRREVAMLRNAFMEYMGDPDAEPKYYSSVIDDTQATAEAYEREVIAKARRADL